MPPDGQPHPPAARETQARLDLALDAVLEGHLTHVLAEDLVVDAPAQDELQVPSEDVAVPVLGEGAWPVRHGDSAAYLQGARVALADVDHQVLDGLGKVGVQRTHRDRAEEPQPHQLLLATGDAVAGEHVALKDAQRLADDPWLGAA